MGFIDPGGILIGPNVNLMGLSAVSAGVKYPVLFIALLSGSVLSAGTGPQAPPMIYQGEAQAGPLGDRMEILEDRSSDMQIQDVIANPGFTPCTSAVPNLGVSRSAFWVKTKVINASTKDGLILLIDNPEVDYLDIFVVQNGQVDQVVHGGQLRPLAVDRRDAPAFSYKLPIPYGAYADVYVRLKGDKQLQAPLFILNAASSIKFKLDRNLFIGGYIGIMLVMLLYNLFIFLSIREKSYLYYSVYIFFVLLTQLSLVGYSSYYLWPDHFGIIRHSSTTLTVLTMISAVEFMQRFINIPAFIQRYTTVKSAIYVLAIGAAIACVAGYDVEGYQVIQFTSAFMAIYMMYIAVKITRTGQRQAKYFLLAWSVFVVGIVVFVAKDWGILPFNDVTKHMMTIGSSVEVVLISFGLADKINVLRREKENSQAEALRMAKENARMVLHQNQELEHKVAERTHELQESNDHLKRTQSQLVSAEKMASLGQLTAGIAHEINNPLNFISSNLPPLKRNLLELKDVLDAYRRSTKDLPALGPVRELEERMDLDYTVQEVQEIMESIEHGATRTSEIVRGLRTFSRLDEDDLKPADINEGLRSTVVVLGPQFRDVVRVQYDLGELPLVECYPGKLNQVFMNLLNNAAHAVKQRHGTTGGQVWISTRLEGGLVTVAIKDNGIGMDEDVQRRLFEPFFTTKGVGEGTGLGLSITQGIIAKHHGQIHLESTPGVGSTFIITLPVTQAGTLAKSA